MLLLSIAIPLALAVLVVLLGIMELASILAERIGNGGALSWLLWFLGLVFIVVSPIVSALLFLQRELISL